MTRAVVLDTGALIAVERHDRGVWLVLERAAFHRVDVLVPSTVVAQVWRGGRSQAMLARALDHCVVSPFDGLARAVGELCGKTRTTDICDAHVALVAARFAEVLYTSDPGDMRVLLTACGRRPPRIVLC